MHRSFAILTILLCSVVSAQSNSSAEIKSELSDSLVHIKAYAQSYNDYMPWKKKPVRNLSYYGSSVSENEIITTAEAVINATYIKIKRPGQNDFISARVKFVDYSLNLALLEVDPGEMLTPLKPIAFGDYKQGAQLDIYWLDSTGKVTTGRAYMDRAQVFRSDTSHTRNINFVAASVSQESGWGEVIYDAETAIGIACWYNEDDSETGIIPGETINAFLADCTDGQYEGFGMSGFDTVSLIDPVKRRFLNLPEDQTDGVLVVDVYNIGSGSGELKKNDVILSIDSNRINAHGEFEHPEYESINYEYLITRLPVGQKTRFEICRQGEKMVIDIVAQNFTPEQMLIPYYERSTQPLYLVRGGYVFQRLTRNYLRLWGDNWSGKVPPYLYYVYKNSSFKPTLERQDIVILSQVIPHDINLGYQGLRQQVVKEINEKNICTMKDVFDAFAENKDSNYDIIELELDTPTIVIDREKVTQADVEIASRYNISQLANSGE